MWGSILFPDAASVCGCSRSLNTMFTMQNSYPKAMEQIIIHRRHLEGFVVQFHHIIKLINEPISQTLLQVTASRFFFHGIDLLLNWKEKKIAIIFVMTHPVMTHFDGLFLRFRTYFSSSSSPPKCGTEGLEVEGLSYMGILHCCWREEDDNMSQKIICVRNKGAPCNAGDGNIFSAWTVNVRPDGGLGEWRLQQPLKWEIFVLRSALCAFMASVGLLHSIPLSQSQSLLFLLPPSNLFSTFYLQKYWLQL